MSIELISYYLLLLGVSGIGLFRYKRLTVPFRLLTLSMIVALLLTVVSLLWSLRYRSNMPIVYLEFITGYIFYSLTYYYLFKNKKIKKAILISIIIIVVFFFINAMFLQPFNIEFPTNLYYPAQVIYATLSLLLFKEMLMYPLRINITKQGVFWYNIAMLFYATTMFLNLGLSNYLGKYHLSDYSKSFLNYFWYFILDVFAILIGVSLLIQNKEIAAKDA